MQKSRPVIKTQRQLTGDLLEMTKRLTPEEKAEFRQALHDFAEGKK